MVCVLSFKRLPLGFCLLAVVAFLVIPATADPTMQQLDQTGLFGGDYNHFDTYDAKSCATHCLSDATCLGSTYVKPGIQGPNAVCWLKDKTWDQRGDSGMTSFIKVDMQQIDETDLMGGDYYRVDWDLDPDMTPQWCSDYCLAKTPCVASTYVNPGTVQGPNPVCILKKAGYEQYRHLQATSFIKVYPSFTTNPGGGGWWESCMPSFEATPLSGPVGLAVSFTDTSPASRSWNWDFDNDGEYDSYDKNPTHTYDKPGVYSVELTIGCTLHTNTVTKEDLISVGDGTLDVSSTPSGAAIYVDDVYKGVTTLKDIPVAPGGHTVRLTKEGYIEQSKPVTVTAGKTVPVSVTLVPQAPTTGSLSLTSIPSGASVTMDGRPEDKTPVVIPDVTAGSHSLTFSLAGYLDHTTSVNVAGGDTATYHAVLQKETASTEGGSLSVASVPDGASISLDGVYKGVTPLTIPGISPGSHALVLSLPGYETYRVSASVASGDTASYSANLVKTGSTMGVTTRVTDRVTDHVTDSYDTDHTTDDWGEEDEDMPGFAGIGGVIAVAAVVLLVAKRPGR